MNSPHIEIKSHIKSCFMVFICVILTNCNANKVITKPDNETIKSAFTPKIIFLNYTIHKGDGQLLIAALHSKTIVDGTFKQKNETQNEIGAGDLTCIQLDDQSQNIEAVSIKNPLIKNIEYVTPAGSLSTKQIELDSAKVSIRMQLSPSTKSIALELISAPNQLMLKTEL